MINFSGAMLLPPIFAKPAASAHSPFPSFITNHLVPTTLLTFTRCAVTVPGNPLRFGGQPTTDLGGYTFSSTLHFLHTLTGHQFHSQISLCGTRYIQRMVLELGAYIAIDLRQPSPARVSPLLFAMEGRCRRMKQPEK